MRFKKTKKLIIGLAVVGVLSISGIVFGLNGFFGGGGSIPSDTMTRGLVGYWNFEEGRSTTTADISGNNNTGKFVTAASSPAWTSGKLGSALSFDGVDDYVSVPDTTGSVLDITTAITISAWVKSNGIIDNYPKLIIKPSGSGWVSPYFYYNLGAGDASFKAGFAVISNTNEIFSGVLTIGQWYHFVGTYDGQIERLYVDGVQVNTKAVTGSIPTSNEALAIGIRSITSQNERFNGSIDEVRIYNRALSAAEVRYHYNRGGPIGYWKFDEGSGTTAYDSSGQGNTGTLTNGPTFVSGKYASALSFDGVNDYVSVPTASSTEITGAITLSAWVKLSGDPVEYSEIVDKESGNNGYSFQVRSDRKVYMWSGDGVDWLSSGGTTVLQNGIWYYVVGIHDGSQLKVYVNGIPEGTPTTQGAPGSATVNLMIGSITGGTSRFFNGLIDDVRIYNYARTADEIRLDYNAGFSALFGPSAGSGQAPCDIDPGACMTKGLVGQWSMDEGRGTTTSDISGNSNTGTLTSGPAWTSGNPSKSSGQAFGSALSFDGTDDYVNVGAGASLNITGNITVSAWVKSSTGDKTQRAASRQGDYILQQLGTVDGGSNGIRFGIYKSSAFYSSGESVSINDNTWHHVVGVNDGTNLKIYIDGVLKNSSANGGSPDNVSVNFEIGRFSGGTEYWNGLMDDVRIYNRALSASEVRYHYNRGGPIGYWKFDEGTATTTYDSSGNNNTGQMLTAASSPTWVSGKYASALNFDGVNDYVNAGNAASLNFGTGDVTYEAWVKPNTLIGLGGILFKGNSGTGVEKGIGIAMSGSNVRVQVTGNTELSFLSNTILTNTWYHLVLTKSSSITSLYINGQFDKNGNSPAGSIDTSITQRIGMWGDAGSYFNGLIDDVRIYNYARTQEQILQDYNAGFAALFGPQTDCDRDPGSCMTKGLVGQWSMDEGRGTTAADISGNNNTGTLTNGPAWTSGNPSKSSGQASGGALSFDGTDDYVDAGDGVSLQITDAITISVWIKRKANNPDNASIIKKGPLAAGIVGWVLVTGWSPTYTNKISFYAKIGGVWDNIVTGVLNDNQWYHVVAIYTGSARQLYVDGVLVSQAAASGALDNPANSVKIGGRYDNYFNGLIDEVRIYNRALTATEIRYAYNRGGPIGYWKFDEGSGTTAYDASGNANTGTLTNGPTFASGKYGSALNFDGVNDYVDAGNGASLGPTDAITIEAWIKSSSPGLSQVIVSKGFNGTYTPYMFQIATNNKIFFGYYSGSWVSVTSNKTVVDGVWHHIVGILRDTTMKIYIDGVEDGSGTGGPLPTNAKSVTIGMYDVNGPLGDWFNGLIDDVRIYNYARTQEQIMTDYNRGFNIYFK